MQFLINYSVFVLINRNIDILHFDLLNCSLKLFDGISSGLIKRGLIKNEDYVSNQNKVKIYMFLICVYNLKNSTGTLPRQ
jgi:hypothetical protein